MKLTILVLIIVIMGVIGFYATQHKASERPANIPTSADDAAPGSIHNLPVPSAVAAVRTYVAAKLGVREGLVIIMTAFEREWPDSCLGLGARYEMVCAQVITQGWEVSAQAAGETRTYRTNADGSEILEEK